MRACGFGLLAALVIGGVTACGSEVVMKLGGVRDVTATVSATEDAYRVAVEMVAVKAFDPATNKRLNQAKARSFAFQALAKYLKAGKNAQFAVSGVQAEKSGMARNTYHLAIVVPREGVVLAKTDGGETARPDKRRPPPKKPQPTRESDSAEIDDLHVAVGSAAADFLNAKSDYLDTIARLEAALCDDAVAGEKRATDGDAFYAAISDLEERAEAAFKSLGSQIDADKFLLGVEREEIRPALETARGEVLKALKSAVAQFDQRQEKPKVKKEKKK